MKNHNGWSGNFETSWRTIKLDSAKENAKQTVSTHINQLNGADNIIYWSDITSEIAFILPNGLKSSSLSANTSTFSGKFRPECGDRKLIFSFFLVVIFVDNTVLDMHASLSASQVFLDESLKYKSQFYASEVKLFVIWLEQIQDLEIIPLSNTIRLIKIAKRILNVFSMWYFSR